MPDLTHCFRPDLNKQIWQQHSSPFSLCVSVCVCVFVCVCVCVCVYVVELTDLEHSGSRYGLLGAAQEKQTHPEQAL